MSRVLPILFNMDMVRAILDGRKTVTRRLMKPQLPDTCPECMYIHNEYIYDTNAQEVYCASCGEPLYKSGISYKVPYQPGDTMYVRETWNKCGNGYRYKADWEKDDIADIAKWRPSIHMPKGAARIWLKVMDVRVERLQDMKPEDIRKEGMWLAITPNECKSQFNKIGAIHFYEEARKKFSELWNSTLKKSDLARYGWDANPWVWVIEFERCEKPEIL